MLADPVAVRLVGQELLKHHPVRTHVHNRTQTSQQFFGKQDRNGCDLFCSLPRILKFSLGPGLGGLRGLGLRVLGTLKLVWLGNRSQPLRPLLLLGMHPQVLLCRRGVCATVPGAQVWIAGWGLRGGCNMPAKLRNTRSSFPPYALSCLLQQRLCFNKCANLKLRQTTIITCKESPACNSDPCID